MPRSTPLASILGWLHAGYPEGVPPKDFYPLLALLARTLDDDELDQIVTTLIEESRDGTIHERQVSKAIEEVKQAPPNQSDVRDVAARLAAAGWPLGDPDAPRLGERSPAAAGRFGQAATPEPAASSSAQASSAPADAATVSSGSSIVQRIADWFDIGYPEGVPATDRVPILALLRRRLTDDEVEQIARRLEHESEGEAVAPGAAETLIAEVTQADATEHDLERVAARLAARGWPLAMERPQA